MKHALTISIAVALGLSAPFWLYVIVANFQL